MLILAIDLGKYNSMCCFYDTKTQKVEFQKALTTRRYHTPPGPLRSRPKGTEPADELPQHLETMQT